MHTASGGHIATRQQDSHKIGARQGGVRICWSQTRPRLQEATGGACRHASSKQGVAMMQVRRRASVTRREALARRTSGMHWL